MRMTMKSSLRKQTMNATKRSAARAGLVVCSVLAIALTGCRTQVVHQHARTVYVPAPAPVVYVPPAPAPQPQPVVVVQPPVQPSVVVIQSENDFYEPLAAHGRWEVVGTYGRCWIPGHVEAGWRPYSNGYWQRTDAGWYWVSEEPWGWATYHYGRWDWHAAHGWVWVPHTQWAPAWVSWREGGGYVGWAPLRPSVTIGVNIGTVEYEPAHASRAYVFVEHRRMLEPVRPKTVIVNNTTIINKTVNITNVKVVNKTVINEGPRPEIIERASGRKVLAVPAHEFRRREETSVAARQHNRPTSPESRVQAPARIESQTAQKQIVTPRNAHVIEKPASEVTPPAKPLATTPRGTLPQNGAAKPARAGTRIENESVKKPTATTPMVAPATKPEIKPVGEISTQREIRAVEKSSVAAKPTPRPATTNPLNGEKKNEAAILPMVTTKTPMVAPTAKPEAKPARAVTIQREVGSVEKSVAAVKPTARTVATNPVRIEKKTENAIARKPAATPPVTPTAKPEVKPARAMTTQREIRSVEKPTVAARPTPQPVTTNPIREERKHETVIESKHTATPATDEPKTGNAIRRVTKPEAIPAAKTEEMPSFPASIQPAPPAGRPTARQLVSPSEKSRAREQAEVNKNAKPDNAPGVR